MRPYLVYGFGIRAQHLPSDVRQRLMERGDVFVWFAEAGAADNGTDTGVFYLLKSSPFERDEDGTPDLCWATNLDRLIAFRDRFAHLLDDRIRVLDLGAFGDRIEFICSVTQG